MSAVFAVFQPGGHPVDPEIIQAILYADSELSVDSDSIWIHGPVALAQQHYLNWRDADTQTQPLVVDKANLAIVCDARLDNRSELIQRLNLSSHPQRPLNNALLILSAYRCWGPACVDHLLGDFAFIIWDGNQNQIFAGRDALGARNLCYAQFSNCLILASDITQILAVPGFSPRINREKIAEYLTNLQQNQSQTFFENIYYLPPAHSILIGQSSITMTRYWDIHPDRSLDYSQEADYVEYYQEILIEAVRCRLPSNGTIGISMSGGFDSTSLTAIACRLLPEISLSQQKLPVFSYRFKELTQCDEEEYILEMLKNFPLEAISVFCDELWPLKNLEEWPVDPGYILTDAYALLPLAVIAAAQQAECRVLLAGYFGDVLFEGGYYWLAENFYRFKPFHLMEVFRSSLSYPVNHPRFEWKIDFFNFGLRPLIPLAIKRHFRGYRPRSVDHFGLTADLEKIGRVQLKIAERNDQTDFKTPGRWSRYQSMTLNSFSQGAAATRKQYNRCGIELETPYWDRRLIEYFMAIPADLLYRGGVDRYLFRQAMTGILPEAVRKRTNKTIFLPLIKKGLIEKESATIRRLLTNPLIVQLGLIRPEWLHSALENPSGWIDYGTKLWPGICLEIWLRKVMNVPVSEQL